MTKKNKIVFVHGDFYVLHPGHIRFLKFASTLGDRLIVGVHNSQPAGSFPTPEDRVEALHSLSISLEPLIISGSLKDFACQLKPDVIVKGREHQLEENPEVEWLASWGGELIFASGDSTFFYNDYGKYEAQRNWVSSWVKPDSYIKRHQCSREKSRIITLS
jgi:cytidyltransferase-like protein